MEVTINKDYIKYETDYLYSCLLRYNFFIDNGYTDVFPSDVEFTSLLKKASDGFVNYLEVEKFISEYSVDYECFYLDYFKYVDEVNNILRDNISLFNSLNKSFGFKIFSNYTLNISKYGPGGSYNSIDGIIISKYNNKNIVSNLLHEIVHIGLEDCIMKKYSFNHVTKEYIVDMFMKSNFGKYFSDYKVQSINDLEINSFIKNTITLDFNWFELNEFIKKL